jgi:hypothetical protein
MDFAPGRWLDRTARWEVENVRQNVSTKRADPRSLGGSFRFAGPVTYSGYLGPLYGFGCASLSKRMNLRELAQEGLGCDLAEADDTTRHWIKSVCVRCVVDRQLSFLSGGLKPDSRERL